jgi:hypothetical protein
VYSPIRLSCPGEREGRENNQKDVGFFHLSDTSMAGEHDAGGSCHFAPLFP